MSYFDDKDEVVESINSKMKLSDSEKIVIYSQVKDKIEHKKPIVTSMRSKYFLALASASFLFFLLLFPTITSFLQDNSGGQRGGEIPNEIVEVVNKYFDSYEEMDIDSLVQFSHDIRHSNKGEQREQYISINEPTTRAEVLDIKKVKTDEYEVTVRFYDDEGTFQLSFPVKEMDIGWQVVVGFRFER
ncbi:hypothetical protein ACERII_19320 [Evansella sp. AB-rgal1]|uniref:hypothetical protein n=1 Tax=Evansella sp. AB-rgal1 TaxID=3242696 RepID=UPI00359E53DE